MQPKLIVAYRKKTCQWLVLLFAVRDTLLRDKEETQACDSAGMAKAGPIQQYSNQNGAREMLLITVCYTQLSESKYLHWEL